MIPALLYILPNVLALGMAMPLAHNYQKQSCALIFDDIICSYQYESKH